MNKFQHAGERTWLAQYKYELGTLGLNGLTFCAVAYQVPTGTLKGLGVTWKKAHASPDISGATVQDENRFYVSYVVPLW